MQKSFFRLIMLIAFLLFIGVFFYAVQVEKNNKPPEEMRLPAAASFGRAAVDGKSAAANSLTIQHMASQEVSMLLTEIIAQSLTFNRGNYTANITGVKKFFTDAGYEQYIQFLKNSSFQPTLDANDLQAGAYVDGQPVELARGVYGGVFKWVFETPVTISLIPRTAATYENGRTTPQNRNFTLRAQMARVNDPQDPNAVKIELWQVLPPRPKK